MKHNYNGLWKKISSWTIKMNIPLKIDMNATLDKVDDE